MSNGGYKGASPARETSPEQYPGVWELTEQFQAQADGNWPFQPADCAPRSLRFDSARYSTLSRTPAVASNRRVFTFSCWVKRHQTGANHTLFGANTDPWFSFYFDSNDKLSLYYENSGSQYWTSNAVFRDPSAWYHTVLSVNTTRSTSDRVKFYVNGEELTFGSTGSLSQGHEFIVNSTVVHDIGNRSSENQLSLDGTIAWVHFIDGQALSPQEFGFFDGQGIWQPKRFTGDYSSGPFYSNNSSTLSDPVNAFDGSTSTFSYVNSSGALGEFTGLSIPAPANSTMRVRVDSGSAGNIKLNGSNVASFNGGAAQWVTVASANIPSLITSIGIQSSSGPGIAVVELNGVALIDASVGRNSFHLDFSDGVKDQSGLGNDWTANNLEVGNAGTTVSAATGALPVLNTSGDYGGTVDSGVRNDSLSSSIVLALPLNGSNGGTTITDYHHTIKGSGSAKAVSIYTGSASGGAVTSTAVSRYYGSSFYAVRGATNNYTASDYIYRTGDTDLNLGTGDFCVEFWYYPQSMTSNSVMFDNRHESNSWPNSSNGFALIHNAAGSIWSYSGGNPIITHGNKLTADQWNHVAYTRDSGTERLFVNGDFFTTTVSSSRNYNEGRFHLGSAANNGEGSSGYYQGLRIYKGTAKYTSNFTVVSEPDYSNSDSFLDSPVNGNEASTGAGGERRGNYATLNPLASDSPLLNGNLESDGASGAWKFGIGTIPFPESGKWYFEVQATAYSGNFGIAKLLSSSQINTTIRDSSESTAVWYAFDGKVWSRYSGQGSTTSVQTGLTTFNNGDIVGFGVNVDDEEVKFYVNGSLQYTYSLPPQIAADLTAGKLFPIVDTYGGVNAICNFGQRPFSSPLSGFSPLATSFLPEPTIKRGDEAMDVALWTGNGSTQTISGLNHSPDLIWHKISSIAGGHQLYDSVRGVSKRLRSDTSAAESTVNGVTAFNSDGWTMTGGNNDNENYVSWSWDAGDATTTIAVGSLNSSAYLYGNWTSMVTGNYSSAHGWGTTYQTLNAFDGNLSTMVIPHGSDGWKFEPTTPIAGNKIEIRGWNDGCPNAGLKINGNDYGDALGPDQTVGEWYTLPYSTLESIELAGDGSAGNTEFRLQAIRIDGRLLVDSSATPPNLPSIATTVRARPETGFSIASYVGTGANGSVAHQLNSPPELVIIKSRTSAFSWVVWHGAFGTASDTDYFLLEGGTGKGAAGSYNFWGNAAPTSSVVNIGTQVSVNNNTADYIGYFFTSIEGYSAFGSYTANGSSTDGPFVFTGFAVAWLMTKRSNASGSWEIHDLRRPGYNPQDERLLADSAANEAGGNNVDLLSNGFKVRNSFSGMNNTSGDTYLYAAFASHPFASNARAR